MEFIVVVFRPHVSIRIVQRNKLEVWDHSSSSLYGIYLKGLKNALNVKEKTIKISSTDNLINDLLFNNLVEVL